MFGKEYVYIIQMGDTNYYKIGITTDIKYRLKALQTGNPLPLTTKALFTTTKKWVRQFEQIFHTELSYCKCTGEWFNFNHNEIQILTNLAKIYDNMVLSDFDMIYIKKELEILRKKIENNNNNKNNKKFLKKVLTKFLK